MALDRTVAIYYEHPDWFRPLFAELDRRGVPWRPVHAARHRFDPRDTRPAETEDAFVLNRMSPSAWKRGLTNAIGYTRHYLAYLDALGVPVMNGRAAFEVETSKALQVTLIERLGLAVPRTRVAHDPASLAQAALGLTFPVLVKPNVGGSGAGIVRFDRRHELEEAAAGGGVTASLDGTLLVQEFHPPRGRSIVRVETLGGRYLYGIRVHLEEGAGFNLCPADVCKTTGGQTLTSAACPAGAGVAGVSVEAYTPPRPVVESVERLARAARLDVGGIEYLESERDGALYFYDVNALSNFVADPVRVLGFDPTARLVDDLVARAGKRAA